LLNTTKSDKTKEPIEFGYFEGDAIYDEALVKTPIIEGFLYEKDVTFIVAPPKTGKSILLLQILSSLTTGTPLFGMLPVMKKCRVLFLQMEGDRGETAKRITNMKKALKIDDTMWTLCNKPGLALNKDGAFSNFLAELRSLNRHYDVIILDPLYTTMQGNLSDSEAVTAWQHNVRTLCAEYGCAIIVAAHPPKPSNVDGVMMHHTSSFGSTFWDAYVNQTLHFSKNKGVHVLTTIAQRSEDIVDKIELNLIEPSPLMFVLREENLISSESNVIKILIDKGALNMRALEHASGLSRASTYRVVGMLRDKGKVRRTEDGAIELIPVNPDELL
jgi:hypothetical protein